MEKLLKSKTVQLISIKVDDYVTREFTWNDLWISRHGQLNNIFFLLFDCKSRNQHNQVARLGDQEYILSHPRPNVSRLRRLGAVRAQPWLCSCVVFDAPQNEWARLLGLIINFWLGIYGAEKKSNVIFLACLKHSVYIPIPHNILLSYIYNHC